MNLVHCEKKSNRMQRIDWFFLFPRRKSQVGLSVVNFEILNGNLGRVRYYWIVLFKKKQILLKNNPTVIFCLQRRKTMGILRNVRSYVSQGTVVQFMIVVNTGGLEGYLSSIAQFVRFFSIYNANIHFYIRQILDFQSEAVNLLVAAQALKIKQTGK